MTINNKMQKIQIEIPDGKRAEWVNSVLTLVDDKPIEYKYKVGDMVKSAKNPNIIGEVTSRFLDGGKPAYRVRGKSGWLITSEDGIKPLAITERIKTFSDACEWCDENGEQDLVNEYTCVCTYIDSDDVLAHLKLRIITCALNEGWKWEPGKQGFGTIKRDDGICPYSHRASTDLLIGRGLLLRTLELANYATNQFRDIYADFCGCKKGGEE